MPYPLRVPFASRKKAAGGLCAALASGDAASVTNTDADAMVASTAAPAADLRRGFRILTRIRARIPFADMHFPLMCICVLPADSSSQRVLDIVCMAVGCISRPDRSPEHDRELR
jgi:hypothetical protein